MRPLTFPLGDGPLGPLGRASLSAHNSVRVATTEPIALAGLQTIDGVVLVDGDTVLVKDQASKVYNGPYVVRSGGWSRSDDFRTGQRVSGIYFGVKEGEEWEDSLWFVVNDDGNDLVGTDLLEFKAIGRRGGGTWVDVRNETGSPILRGKAVAIIGWSIAHNLPLVALADRTVPTRSPAIGLTIGTIANGTNGSALVSGIFEYVNTSVFSTRDLVALGVVGGLSLAPPVEDPFSGEVQSIGQVLRSHATDGELLLNLDVWPSRLTDSEIFGIKLLPRGHFTGGEMTRDGGRNLRVAAGEGYVTGTDSKFKRVLWIETVLALDADLPETFVSIDVAGVISATPLLPSLDKNIVLGNVKTNATDIVYLSRHRVEADKVTPRLHSYASEVLGPLTVSGGVVAINSGNARRLDVNPCIFYLTDNRQSVVGTNAIPFFYWYRDGSGDWTIASATLIDNANYDDASGTLASLPVGKWRKDALFLAPNDDGTGVEYHVVLGQAVFDSQIDAEDGPIPLVADELLRFSLRLAGVVIEQGASSITSIIDLRPFLGQSAPTSSATNVHGNLAGLLADNHPQYAKTDGSRAFTGSVDLGGHNITNVGLVDGRNVSADGAALSLHLGDADNPHSTSLANIDSGTLADLNAAISDANVDATGTPRPPTGGASGDLGNTYPNPKVIALTEAGAATRLLLGTIGANQLLKRVGAAIIGVAETDIAVGIADIFQSALASTTSATFIDGMAGGFIQAPSDGDYLVFFISEVYGSSNNTSMEIGIGFNSTSIPVTGAIGRVDSSAPGNYLGGIAVALLTGVLTTDQVHGIFRRQGGSGSANIARRHLFMFKVKT